MSCFGAQIVPGIDWAAVGYLVSVHLVSCLLTGGRSYNRILAISAMISLPVVFGGGSISYLMYLLNMGGVSDPYFFGAHYLELAITMLSVVPVALSMVAVIPMGALEQRLIRGRQVVTRFQKSALMCLRVFNHVLFNVIPSIVEIMHEEGIFHTPPQGTSDASRPMSLGERWQRFHCRSKLLLQQLIQVGVQGICSAIEYIPLWSVEISQLPEATPGKQTSDSIH